MSPPSWRLSDAWQFPAWAKSCSPWQGTFFLTFPGRPLPKILALDAWKGCYESTGYLHFKGTSFFYRAFLNLSCNAKGPGKEDFWQWAWIALLLKGLQRVLRLNLSAANELQIIIRARSLCMQQLVGPMVTAEIPANGVIHSYFNNPSRRLFCFL